MSNFVVAFKKKIMKKLSTDLKHIKFKNKNFNYVKKIRKINYIFEFPKPKTAVLSFVNENFSNKNRDAKNN